MTVSPPVPIGDSTDSLLDGRAPQVRLGRLLDPGSAVPLHDDDGSGVQAVHGLIDGLPAVAYCTDARLMGGSLGAAGARRVAEAIDTAVLHGCPVIGLWHSGGARLADGVESMDGVGRMFAAMTLASGVVPQISVVLGPAAGAAAYGPALTDVVIMAEDARIFVTGPDIVRSVTGEQIDMAGLGGPGTHGPRSGVAHLTVEDEDEAYARARRLAAFFSRPGTFDPTAPASPVPDPRVLLPQSPRRAYDVRPLVHALLDRDAGGPVFEELQPRWAANVLTGLGRLAGRTVGVLANNPIRKGGCLDSLSAEKSARFVRMCDSHGVPLVVLVDVPGYLPGVDQEWGGVVRRGAKLLHAFAESVVPRVTLITRKAYGGAYIAMNSRSLGATAVFAWPGAEVAVMGAESAVGVLHRKRLAAAPEHEREALRAVLTEEHRRIAGGVERATALGVVDEVIAPETTRVRLAEALARAPRARGRHSNIPL
ncbi:acyl-CoA carboxylase subunit beta [Nonomuraea rhodomycinica]|uniref:Acyl-CoA carboxylase subunit beta n=1 Tax=Nonomuraea rhodomycinica TaxID=1712872 RepID=A0A7Y6IPU4_9ACTN|nr:carboxyl transferase domain-containing protein [Nonomuraea rhodomycinica]NUW42209.1 acyl-CoA carboxylase subunit beta [Nonomuraea rhodomycinica]